MIEKIENELRLFISLQTVSEEFSWLLSPNFDICPRKITQCLGHCFLP